MTRDDALLRLSEAYIPATYRRTVFLIDLEGPQSVHQIAEHLGMTIGSTYKLLVILHDLKVLCVKDYVRSHTHGPWTKRWGLGSRNAPPPQKRTSAERSAAWRERKRPRRLGVFGI